MSMVWKTGTTIHAASDSGPSVTRIETTLRTLEYGHPYPLANLLVHNRAASRPDKAPGLTVIQKIAILLAALFLIYITW